MSDWVSKEFERVLGDAVNTLPWLERVATGKAVNTMIGATRKRPHPWSTFSDYTSWQGLTDRTYLARHLPPVPEMRTTPDHKDVDRVFARPDGAQVPCSKSTCLFPAFAQYLTDGFIRTNPNERNRTTSNHEIDLCPLYGRTPGQTALLRLNSDEEGRRGRLKSQTINGEEYAPFAYRDDGTEDPAFRPEGKEGLDPILFGVAGKPPIDRLATLFAFGGDRANSTPFTAMMNTLLLREHNRLADGIERLNPLWDDERVFQTARNVMIPMFIRIVIEEYINHITPLPFRLVADPSIAWSAGWNRPNWMTAEFSLLYRWHSLMPDHINWPGTKVHPPYQIPLSNFMLNNTALIEVGLDAAFTAASAQPAAALGALNTSAALMPMEVFAVQQARFNRIDNYNAYREAFGMPVAESFDDITTRPEVAAILADLYETPDDVEFYPGLFAEDRVKNSPLPGLLMRMVAVDAFSQALTNPLLSEHVYNEDTFSPWGFEQIHDTTSIGRILERQLGGPSHGPIGMTQPDWEYE